MAKNSSSVDYVPKRKKKNSPLGLIYVIIGLIAIAALLFLLIRNLRTEKVTKLDMTKRQLLVGKSNLFAIYEDKLALSIPFEISANKDETFQEIVDRKDESALLEAINKILPEKLAYVYWVNDGEIDLLGVKEKKTVPDTSIDGKRYVITSTINNLFDELYNEKEMVTRSNENIIVDILNANGRSGYARRTGEKIEEKLLMKYNPANYETLIDESYIIINDISKEKAQEIVMELEEKYLKIREDVTVPTLANVVVILGKEEKVVFEVNVIGDNDNTVAAIEELKKQGYSNVQNTKTDSTIENSIIEYSPEDYYIAYKLGQYTGVTTMIEKDDLKDRINIIIK